MASGDVTEDAAMVMPSSFKEEMCRHFDLLLARLDQQDEMLEQLKVQMGRPSWHNSKTSTGLSAVGSEEYSKRSVFESMISSRSEGKSEGHTNTTTTPQSRAMHSIQTTFSAFGDTVRVPSAEPYGDKSSNGISHKFSKMAAPTRLQLCTRSTQFQLCFGLFIVLNAVWIGIEVDYEARHQDASDNLPLVTHLFSFLFAIELALRIVAEKTNFFQCSTSPERRETMWNCFDILLVAAGIVEFVIFVVSLSAEFNLRDRTAQIQNLRLIRIVRFVRLLRLLRMARIVRLVRALRVLVYGIVSTLQSLLWAMLLLTMIMYFFAVLFTEATNEYLVDTGGCIGVGCEDDAWRMFGTIPRSMFTLYKSISDGIDWETCALILADIDGVWVAFFVIYVTFSYFAVLNVVTGVFCQSAMECAQRDREVAISTLLVNKKAHVQNIKVQFAKMFERMDLHGNGVVNLEEFKEHMTDDRVSAFFILLDIDPSDTYALFKLLDDDGSGQIDADEFVDGCLRLQGAARSIDLAKVRHECKNMLKKIHNSNTAQAVDLRSNTRVLKTQLKYLDAIAQKINVVLGDSAVVSKANDQQESADDNSFQLRPIPEVQKSASASSTSSPLEVRGAASAQNKFVVV